jgi:hypothetical protein
MFGVEVAVVVGLPSTLSATASAGGGFNRLPRPRYESDPEIARLCVDFARVRPR